MSLPEKIATYMTRSIAWVSVAMFVFFLLYLIYRGVSAFSLEMVSSGGEGLVPAIVGTFFLISLSVLMAVPVGIGAGIYLGAYAKGRLRDVLSFLFELLASIPSIIIGLFGFALILALHKILDGALPSLALAAFAISILILPYIIKATQLGIEETPHRRISIAYDMGATHSQVIRYIHLPAATNHILKGIILSLARASEDTAVIMLTGAVASFGIPASVLEPFEALPFYIYTTAASYGSAAELGSIFVAALFLVSLSTFFVLISGWIERRANGTV
jgi:phosphate transport system permease protein